VLRCGTLVGRSVAADAGVGGGGGGVTPFGVGGRGGAGSALEQGR
jgi:hypothetical protein